MIEKEASGYASLNILGCLSVAFGFNLILCSPKPTVSPLCGIMQMPSPLRNKEISPKCPRSCSVLNLSKV